MFNQLQSEGQSTQHGSGFGQVIIAWANVVRNYSGYHMKWCRSTWLLGGMYAETQSERYRVWRGSWSTRWGRHLLPRHDPDARYADYYTLLAQIRKRGKSIPINLDQQRTCRRDVQLNISRSCSQELGMIWHPGGVRSTVLGCKVNLIAINLNRIPSRSNQPQWLDTVTHSVFYFPSIHRLLHRPK